MSNGLYSHAATPNGQATPPEEPPVVTLNLGLTWRHLAAGVMAVSAAFGSMSAAGWLVLPAKQTDVTRIEQSLVNVERDLKSQQEITLKLIQSIERLDATVQRISVVRKPRKKNAAN